MTERRHDLEPDAIDELLSADIDGELVDAAGDLGLTEEEARAQLAGLETSERRAALGVTRAALDVEPLSEHERARLLRAAREAFDPSGAEARRASAAATRVSDIRTRRFPWGAVAAVAAALVLVAGVAGVVITTNGNTGDDASTAAGPESANTTSAALDTAESLPVQPVPGDLGENAVLRNLLDTATVAGAATLPSQDATGTGGSERAAPTSTTEQRESQKFSDTTSAGDAHPSADAPRAPSAAQSRCLEAFRTDFGVEPIALYSGKDGAVPAIVIVFTLDGQTAATVYGTSTCRQLKFVSSS